MISTTRVIAGRTYTVHALPTVLPTRTRRPMRKHRRRRFKGINK